MECPACQQAVVEKSSTCSHCGYGIAPKPKPKWRGPRYLGDRGDSHDAELSRTYRCDRCRSFGARVFRTASTGAGITRLMDWQIHEFIVASCNYCGLIQHFDPKIVDKDSRGWKLADFFFDFP